MADFAVGFVASRIADKLSRVLIQESAVLTEVGGKVEWIEKELRQMQAYLEHVGRRRQGFDERVEELDQVASDADDARRFDEWVEKLNEVARDAQDVIQDFVIKSVKRRRRGILYLFDRYKVGNELDKIIRTIRYISDLTSYQQANRGLSVIVETPGEASAASASTPNTKVAQAVEKLSNLLSLDLVTRSEVIKIVEQARDELVAMQNIVSSLKPTSQRENVWLEEVNSVCDLTVQVAGDFITARKNRKGHALFPFRRYVSEWKFRKQMEYVETQIGNALYRRLTYGVGEVDLDSGGEIRARSIVVPSSSLQRAIINKVPSFISFTTILFPILAVWAAVVLDFFLQLFLRLFILGAEPKTVEGKQKATMKEKLTMIKTFLYNLLIDFVIFVITTFSPAAVGLILETVSLFYEDIIRQVSLWRSVDRNLKSTQKELVLMRALFNDIKSAQGLTEVQKVWVEQLRFMAQNAQSVIDAGYRKGSFCSKLRFANAINSLLHDIQTISDRKKVYGVADMEGRGGSVSLEQSIQVRECESETNSSVVERDVDSKSSTEQQQSRAPAASSSYRQATGLKQKVQSIKGEKQMMDALFQDAKEMGELNKRSKLWVKEMEGTADEAQSVINEYAEKLEHKPVRILILRFGTQLVIERKLDRIRDKIQDAAVSRNRYGSAQFLTRSESFSVVQRLHRRTQPISSLTDGESSIVGFDDDIEVLTAQLLSNEKCRYIISIVGIGGTGKTTLARLIFDSDDVKDFFEYRAWVEVAPNCTAELLLEDIATQMMGGQKDRWTTRDPIQALKTCLGNKWCLIVVDGIETYSVLDPLKRTILDGSIACRLLLTSRNANVKLRAPGTRTFVHPLQLLDDENSWILFTRSLKKDIPPELIKVGEEIVIKCGGLPSEILKISDLLSEKDVTNEEWSKVLEDLSQDRTPWLEKLNTINMNLPHYLRRCLFYFVPFPADFRIPARRLVVRWIAEDVVRPGEEETLEQVAERYLTELIDMNMVQIAKRKHNGKVKTCRLPNALRELWLEKTDDFGFHQGHNATDSNSEPEKSVIRWVADHLDNKETWYNHIHGTSRSPSTLLRDYYKNVLSLLSFDAREGNRPGQEIGDFLNRCISINCLLLLRVLDLERVYKPKLPKSIDRLSRLRYLGLRWTYLESLPSSISSLLKLQTLDLKHTYINILTSSIWKMELRHLFLSESYRSRFPPQPAGNYLSDLQTLWGLFVDEETPVKGGLDRLVNIRKLGLACQSMSPQPEAMISQLDAVADWLMKLEYLQSLRLKSRDEEGQPWNLHLKSLENHPNLTDIYLLGRLNSSSILSQFPSSLIELTLSHSKLKEDPMQILDLPNLRSLCLLAESYIGKSLACNSGSFPQLHVLKLWRLEQLEEWTIEEQALPSLRQVEIRSCDSLKMLPDGLKDISTLLELKLIEMPMELESRVSNTDGEDRHKISHIPNVWVNDTRLSFASQSSDTSDILPHFEGISTSLQNQKASDVSTSSILQNGENEVEPSCAWKFPPTGWVCLNSNGSVIGNSEAACGGLVRDEVGLVLGGFSANLLGVTYLTIAKLLGVFHGLNLVWDMGRRKVKVDVDSQCALSLIRASSHESYPGSKIIQRIKDLLERDWTVEFCRIHPETNKAGDKLAHMGHDLPIGVLNFISPPTCLADVIRQDLAGVKNQHK